MRRVIDHVIDHVPLGAQLLDQLAAALDVPGDHRVVQHTQATEGPKLIIEPTSPQRALLAEEEEPREVVRGLAFVQLAALLTPVLLLRQWCARCGRSAPRAQSRSMPGARCAGVRTSPADAGSRKVRRFGRGSRPPRGRSRPRHVRSSGPTRVYGPRGGRRAEPEVLIGWPNRFMVATYVLWIGAVATTRSGV